jgi:predicted metal-dependent enzyme (double-stranded beta helix superfamily)
MHAAAFAGADRLIATLDASMAARTPEGITAAVKDGLCGLIRDGAVELPAAVQVPGRDSYARRLLYRSDEHGYVVVAMAWGPGQGTPLHDHAGIWCVEAVCKGEMQVVQYELVEQEGERFRFVPQGSIQSGPGAGGALIPPFEYHTLANAVPGATSITLHVYGHDLERCAIFEADGEGWYRRRFKDLAYTA